MKHLIKITTGISVILCLHTTVAAERYLTAAADADYQWQLAQQYRYVAAPNLAYMGQWQMEFEGAATGYMQQRFKRTGPQYALISAGAHTNAHIKVQMIVTVNPYFKQFWINTALQYDNNLYGNAYTGYFFKPFGLKGIR